MEGEGEQVVLLDLDVLENPDDIHDLLDESQVQILREGGSVEIKVPVHDQKSTACDNLLGTPSSSSSNNSKSSSGDDYKPSDNEGDIDTDGEDFANLPAAQKSKIQDGRQKWNGTIRAPLQDDEWAHRMEAIKKYFLDKELPVFPSRGAKNKWFFQLKKYEVVAGKLFFIKSTRGKPDVRLEVVTDVNAQVDMLKSCHGGAGKSKESKAVGGHLGINNTMRAVSSRFYWPRMLDSVKKFIRSCPECQQENMTNMERGKQTLLPVSVPQALWFQIGIDLMGPLTPSTEGHVYLMTCIDYFSKWIELFPLKSKCAEEVAEKLFNLTCRYGPAKIHITDQGREFVNKISAHLYFLSGQQHRITGAYHPQANGLCERQNRSTLDALRKAVMEKESDWVRVLDPIAYSFRAAPKRALGFKSPFEVMFGRPMRLLVDLRDETGEVRDIDDEEFDTIKSALLDGEMGEEATREEIFLNAKRVQDEVFQGVSQSISKEASKYKAYYDKKHEAGKALEIGTLVMNRNLIHGEGKSGRKGGKMDYKYMGPYIIINVDAKKSIYTLADLEGNELAKKANASNLKLFVETSEAFPKATNLSPLKPVYKSRAASRSGKKKPKKCQDESNTQTSQMSTEVSSQEEEQVQSPVDPQDVIDQCELMRQSGLLKKFLQDAQAAEKSKKKGAIDITLPGKKGGYILEHFQPLLHKECNIQAMLQEKKLQWPVLSTFILMVAREIGERINPPLPDYPEVIEVDEETQPPQFDYNPEGPPVDWKPAPPLDTCMPVFSSDSRKRTIDQVDLDPDNQPAKKSSQKSALKCDQKSVKSEKSVSFAEDQEPTSERVNKLSKKRGRKLKATQVSQRLDKKEHDVIFQSAKGVLHTQGANPDESYVSAPVEWAAEYPFIPAASPEVRDLFAERLCSGLSTSKHNGMVRFRLEQGRKMTEKFITRKVRGDGNCLFRSLSYLVTGSERNHSAIRRAICDYIAQCKQDSAVQRYIGHEPGRCYIDRMRMRQEDTSWGTDVEIYAACQMMECDIFTFTDPHNKTRKLQWQRLPFDDPTRRSEMQAARREAREAGVPFNPPPPVYKEALYLDHSKGNHYDAVVGFK